jgi:uncharacterized protein YegL
MRLVMSRSALLTLLILLISSAVDAQALLVPQRHSAAKQQAASPGTGASAESPDAPAQIPASSSPLPAALPVTAIKINLSISGQVATIKVEHLFHNPTGEMLEGTYYFPVPQGASLEEFAVYDGDERRVGRVKEKEEARAQYSAGIAAGEDPAILEMARSGWFQSHIYPIAPLADKRVEIIYSQILTSQDGAVTFDYPLGLGYKKLKVPVDAVNINVDVRSAAAISNLYSPTHPLQISYDTNGRHATATTTTVGGGTAENFRLQYSLSEQDVGMSLITYRKPGEDGYFLLMLSPKVNFDAKRVSSKDVIFVIDVSGSMKGAKINQAKEALRFGLANTIKEGDRFNIISFQSVVTPMEQGLIPVTPANISRALDFVDHLQAGGSTDINAALVAAMNMFEKTGRAKNLVFLTDGLPEQGIVAPDQISSNVLAANTARAHLFTFGVGSDVNRDLLDRLAAENRGAGSVISDESQLGQTMSGFFSKVSQPVLSNLQVDFGPVLVDRLQPAELPDLYTRSQIKILGRYRNAEDVHSVSVTLSGQMSSQQQQFEFPGLEFPLETTDNASLPNLWATERVNALLAQIRLFGETPALKQEVIALANEFNLVTPYTSMYVPTAAELAREKKEQLPQDGATANMQQLKAPEPVQDANGNFSVNGARGPAAATASGGSGGGIGSGHGAGVGSGQSGKAASLPSDVRSLYVNGRASRVVAPPAPNPAPAAPGTVVDESGAVVPNAKVTIRDKNTGASRTVTTDSSGNYSVAGIPPGNYDVEVSAPGFKKTEVQNVSVQPGQVAAAGVQLLVADATEMVQVTAQAELVDKTQSELSSTQDSLEISRLPNLSPIESLALLTPGVNAGTPGTGRQDPTSAKWGAGSGEDFQVSVNGASVRAINHSLDGQDNNDVDGRPAVSVLNPDAIFTLQVLATGGSGDATLTGASSINVVTRSGSNTYHGSFFGFDLAHRFGALSPLERRTGITSPLPSTDATAGFTLGGPIVRDRVFLFTSLQADVGTPWLFADSTSAYLTPTAQGLTQLAALFPTSPTVADLIDRTPLSSSIGFTRFARTFMLPVLGQPIQFGELTREFGSPVHSYDSGTRLDFNLTARDTLHAKYWYDDSRAANAAGRLASGYTDESQARAQLGGLQWDRALSPAATNQFVLGLNRSQAFVGSSSAGPDEDGSPSVMLGLTGLSYGESPLLPQSHTSTLVELGDTLIYQMGDHNLSLGGHLRRRHTEMGYLPSPVEQLNFTSFNQFVLDAPLTVTLAEGSSSYPFRETDQHYFADDSWRMRKNLTLSFGLGYQYSGQPINGLVDRMLDREENPSTALFDPALPMDPRTLPKVRSDKTNFAPRLGFAYTPQTKAWGRRLFGNDETVIRGGAAIYYASTPYEPLAVIQASAPTSLLAVFGSPQLAIILPAAQTPAYAVPGIGYLKIAAGSDPRNYIRAEMAPDFRTAYSVDWHLSVDRNFNNRVSAELGYIGTRGAGLVQAVQSSPQFTSETPAASPSGADPLGTLLTFESSGLSIYQALQAKIDVRLSGTLTAGVSYTFSKMIDDIPDGLALAGLANTGNIGGLAFENFAQNPSDISGSERALSSLNRTQQLTAHFVVSLPFYKDQQDKLARLLGGWQLTGTMQVSSGQPFTALQEMPYDAQSSAIFASIFADQFGSIRPFAGNPAAPLDSVAFSNAANSFYHFFLNSNGKPYLSPTGFIVADGQGFHAGTTADARFIYNDYGVGLAAQSMGLKPNAFGPLFAAGRPFGDLGRNTLIGPGLANMDFALIKNARVRERAWLQFRAEVYNLFNHPNRGVPNSIVENAGGRGFLDVGDQDAVPRRIRFGVKVTF